MFDLLGLRFGTSRTRSKPHPHLSSITNKIANTTQRAKDSQHGKRSTSSDDYKSAKKRLQHTNPSTADDMGKSNKFDCTNRRNEGVDLGKSIGDAAVKELEKTKKDVLRHAFRARKASTGSITSGESDVNGVHFIDLIAPSKQLTDDGVAAMVAGLHAAMTGGNSQASVALEGLNLRDNNLTTRALATLAPVIELAKNELKTIVLSDNAISVTSDQEALEWEAFLVAFKNCKTLRRLDLSGNHELGARALEVFSRIHCNEPPVDPIALGGDRSVYPLDELSESDANESGTISPDRGPFDRMTSGAVLHRRCGLRSIPYISFKDVGLNDTGALWLSYILQDHYFPNQLLNELNAAPATSSVDAYQQDAVEGGIDWRGYKGTLERDGLALLTKVEAIRKVLTHLESTSSLVGNPEPTSSIKSLSARRFSRASIGSRRSSFRSIHTDDGGEHELTEIESIRKRMQRHIIENRGTNSVVLWKVALTAVITSRKIAYIAPPAARRRVYAGPCLFTSEDVTNESANGRGERLDSVAYLDVNDSNGYKNARLTSPTSTITRNTGRSYAATLGDPCTPGEPEVALTEVTNTPVTPKFTFKAHRKGAFSEGSDLQSLNEKLSKVDLQRAANDDHRPERYLEWQQAKQEREGFEYRNTALACQLPLSAFNRILALTLSTDEWTIGAQDEVLEPKVSNRVLYPSGALLSDDQQREAYEWGQKKETLARERRWATMADSGQQLMLLDAIQCLAYKSSGD